MTFERGQKPLKTLGIGYRQKRIFKGIEEAVKWAILFPEEYTDGLVHSWFGTDSQGRYFFDFAGEKFNTDVLKRKDFNAEDVYFGKLHMVKWAKDNLHWGEYPNERIGLKECKQIFDRVEEIITAEFKNEAGNYADEIIHKLKQKYNGKN
jgi:spermidine/putrescine-binding protein